MATQQATRRSHASASTGPSNRSSGASHRRISSTSSQAGRTEDRQYIGQWCIGRTIGTGSSGRVKVARHRVTGHYAAVKIVPKGLILSSRMSVPEAGARSEKLLLGIEREIVIMKLIDHPNVLSLYDVWETTHDLYLIIEYVAGGELFDYLVRRGRLPTSEALHYFQQIIFAVDYCHRFNICHRDLKPENLLLDKDKNIKVADFGMAAWQADERMLETSCGSPHYASPEIVAGKAYDGTASDIWSCGIILFALLTGRLPFDDDNIRALLQKVKIGYFEMPDDIDPTARDLLRRMLEKDPEQRITMQEIMAHPFFTSRAPRQTGGRPLPTPLSLGAMARPVVASEIDPDILSNLKTLWHGATEGEIYRALMSSDKTWEKAIYHLLVKYRDRHLENYNMNMGSDSEEESDDDESGTTIRSVTRRVRNHSRVPSPKRSPTKQRRIESPAVQQVRRKPPPLRETDSVQSHHTPPPRPQAPTPKKAAMAPNVNVNDSPMPGRTVETPNVMRHPSKLGPRSPPATRSPPQARSPPTASIATMEVPSAPAITFQQATPIKESSPPPPPANHAPPMSPRSIVDVSPPQLPPLSPPQVGNPQLQTFLHEIANQLNSMTIRSSTASSSSANSTIQTPEYMTYLSYMSQHAGTPEHRLPESGAEELRKSPVREEEAEDQFGDAPDDDTEDISLNSISVESRFSPSPVPVPPSPISPIVGLGFGAAPRAPSRNGLPPVSGRWSAASGSYRARSVSSRCESPILTPGLTAGFHSPTPVIESARTSSGSSYGGYHSSTPAAIPPVLPVLLQAERSAPPPPGRRPHSRVPSKSPPVQLEPPIESERIESLLGRENSYVFIDTLDMPDDSSTMSWGQKRGSAFSSHRGTEGFLKKRKKITTLEISSSPALATPPTPKRSWFNNLFSFKPTSYDLIVQCPTVTDGRDIVRRCLSNQGVSVKVVEYDGMRGLKCKVTDTRDINGNLIKGVRFRVEFTRAVIPSEGNELRFGTNACLTLEKGAQSVFTTAFNSLKKAVEAEEKPPVPTHTAHASFSLPRPARAPNQRLSIFDTALNVVPSPRPGVSSSVPNTPQFGPQFGAYQFTGLQRPNTLRF